MRANEARPWLTDAVISTTEDQVLAGAQSRYGPAAPLIHVQRLLDDGSRFAVIAKPCDISAIRRLGKADERVKRQIPYLLTIFCGGAASVHVTKAFLRYLDVDESEVTLLRYRGEGWPGPHRIETRSGIRHELPYATAWLNKPYTHDVQFRCKICPDAVGEVADISAPDGWIVRDGQPCYEEAPGRNVALVRTEAGQRLIHAAAQAGYVELAPMTMPELDPMHANHPARKLGGPVQLLAVRIAGRRRLVARGYRTLSVLRRSGIRNSWRQFSGTLRRLARGEHREPLI